MNEMETIFMWFEVKYRDFYAFYMGFTVKHDLQTMKNLKISVSMMAVSQSFFHVITKSSMTTEKILMIVLRTVKNGYDNMHFEQVALIQSYINIADRLTRFKKNAVLINTLLACQLVRPI